MDQTLHIVTVSPRKPWMTTSQPRRALGTSITVIERLQTYDLDSKVLDRLKNTPSHLPYMEERSSTQYLNSPLFNVDKPMSMLYKCYKYHVFVPYTYIIHMYQFMIMNGCIALPKANPIYSQKIIAKQSSYCFFSSAHFVHKAVLFHDQMQC